MGEQLRIYVQGISQLLVTPAADRPVGRLFAPNGQNLLCYWLWNEVTG
jgi:hypothetical protein